MDQKNSEYGLRYILLYLFAFHFLLPQTLIQWVIGRAMGGGSTFFSFEFSGEKTTLHCLVS